MGREEKFGSGTISKVEAKNRKAISVIGGGPTGLRFLELRRGRTQGSTI